MVKSSEAAPSAGWYTTSDVAWHLPADELPESPRLGDVIVDAYGQRWTILTVRAAALATRWRCVARDLAAAHGLDNTVRIEKASYAKGESGAEEVVWRLWKAGLRARIQPVAQQAKDEHERTVTAATFKVLVAEDLDVDHHCRVRGPDGKTYRVLSYRKGERIDALGEITVAEEG